MINKDYSQLAASNVKLEYVSFDQKSSPKLRLNFLETDDKTKTIAIQKLPKDQRHLPLSEVKLNWFKRLFWVPMEIDSYDDETDLFQIPGTKNGKMVVLVNINSAIKRLSLFQPTDFVKNAVRTGTLSSLISSIQAHEDVFKKRLTTLKKLQQMGLNEFEALQITTYIEENRYRFQEACRIENKSSIYRFPRDTKLARTVQFMEDGRVFIHFNRKKRSDSSLGKGANKEVTFAIQAETGKKYATAGLKIVETNVKITKTKAAQIAKHCAGINAANYRIFAGVPGFIQMESSDVYSKPINESQDVYKQRFVFQLANAGDLFKAISEKTLTSEEKKEIFIALVKSMFEIHKRGLVHRDYKPQNIFLNRDETNEVEALLGDLDSICSSTNHDLLKDHSTTSWYMSPEYADAFYKNMPLAPTVTQAHDMWALGITLWGLMDLPTLPKPNFSPDPKKTPYSAVHLPWSFQKTESNVAYHISSYLDKCENSMLQHLSPKAKFPLRKNSPEALIYDMLMMLPKQRITAEEALKRLDEIIW